MDLEFCLSAFRAMLRVLPVTLALSAWAFVFSLLIAIVVAFIDYYKIPVLRQIGAVYVSFFRGTPLIPQLFLLYFGIPSFVPALRTIPAFQICILGLTLNSAAYMKEAIRGALMSVSHGQQEAALAHGMTSGQCMMRIILPQATRVAIPSLFNNLVDIVKGSSMAFTIGVVEITATANLRAAVTFNYFEAYMVLMLIYWCIILVLERIEAIIEKRMAVGYTR